MNDEIITPDQWFDVEEFNSFSDNLTEEVSVKTRMKLAISARRTSKRRAFLTKIRAKKRKGMAQLKRRARNQVRNEMKRRIGGTNWSKLSYGVRKRLDDIVSKKRKFIDNIVKQVLPKVYKGESERLKRVTQPRKKSITESLFEEKTKSEIRTSATERKRRQRARESELRQIDPSKMAFIVRDITNNKIMIVDKNSFEKEKHSVLVKPENMTYEVAKQYSQDPSFKNTVTSKRILGGSVNKTETSQSAPSQQKKAQGSKEDKEQEMQAMPSVPMQDTTQIDYNIAQWSPVVAINLMKGMSIADQVKNKLITPDQADLFNNSQNVQEFAQKIATSFAEAFLRTTGRSINEYMPQMVEKAPVPTSAIYQQNGIMESMPVSDIVFVHTCGYNKQKNACESFGVSPEEQNIKISVKYGRTNLYSGKLNNEMNVLFAVTYQRLKDFMEGKVSSYNNDDIVMSDSDKESLEIIRKKLDEYFKQNQEQLAPYMNDYDNSIFAVSKSSDVNKRIEESISKLKNSKESIEKLLQNIFSTSRIFSKYFFDEAITGKVKFDNSAYSASHILAINADTGDIKFEKLDESTIDQLLDSGDIKLNIGLQSNLCGNLSEEEAFIKTIETYQNAMKSIPQFDNPMMFCGKMQLLSKKPVKEIYFKRSALSILFEQEINVKPEQVQTNQSYLKEPTPAQQSMMPKPQTTEQMSEEEIERKTFENQYYRNYLRSVNTKLKAAKKCTEKLDTLVGMFNTKPIMLEIIPIDFYMALEERMGAKVTPIVVNGKQKIIHVINTPVFDYNNLDAVQNPMENYHFSFAKQFLAERRSKKHNKSTGRDYKSEYENYHSRPDQIKDRASRTTARRRAIRKGLVKKGDGNDIDHKNKNPRDNRPSNLRVRSKSANRADHR